ncbi:RNA polymerase sigma-54 factor [Beggiatoa alba B18LD]|uniref:RNA polymerase sigma-54 factor n=1 Tax=Beggiatoa alba B18LD TaxID=395493 RepID=I3CJ78_9GAMM|nr:RNA polymerase factor sigma-54 [Beggiatoa alba]EIJ43671.1 RNA polymerase sigma-54 factor [Beggiatoa alba B18LD]
MKQSLQLRLGQQITMTPQLQQAIRLLQLSTLDLQLEIQQALESNIMLEATEGEYDDGVEDYDDNPATPSPEIEDNFKQELDRALNNETETTTPDIDEDYGTGEDSRELVMDNASDIPESLAVDSDWEDIYDGALHDYPTANADGNGKDLLFSQNAAEQTLTDHLRWQLDLTPFSNQDRAIATAIIDAIDGDGYLRASIEDLMQSLGEGVIVESDEVEAVLHRVQHFDPVGIGARDLAECLQLQLDELPKETLWLTEAKHLVKTHLSVLADHDYPQLAKLMKLSREDLREVVNLIQTLNPRPGAQMEVHQSNYIVPDVYVKKIKGQWKVELNPEITPKLRINRYYADLISRSDSSRADVSNLKNHLQEARWFIKSLKSRHETLLKVANCIVKRQTAFLEYGEEAMKPLVLHDIASELEMHESTISRVTTQKYIHTSRGIFELKYFFSSHVSTNTGGECSSTAIRALIKKLIAAENAAKPLSDSKIASMLSERGINVARRTVAKYREAMVIPPSNERKRLV